MIFRTPDEKGARITLRSAVFAATLLTGIAWELPGGTVAAYAASQGIVVIVNDQPITNRDIDQRIKLNSALGDSGGSLKKRKKRTLNTLINEVVARGEAKKQKVSFGKKRVDEAIDSMAKGAGTTVAGLEKTLKGKGVSMSTLRTQVEATLLIRWIIGQKQKTEIKVSDAELDKRYSKVTADPRLKPVTLYQIREVTLPLGPVSKEMEPHLVNARAVEAQQIARKYKGCNSLKSASKGIFNVKISQMVQAPSDKMPADMRNVLKKAGTKKLIGPMRIKAGIRLIAFCGVRKLSPPKPPREAVKSMILREKYDKVTDGVMRSLRRRAFIEYKDKSAGLTQ